MAALEPSSTFHGRRLAAGAVAVAAVAWIGLLIGFRVARATAFFAYLTAFSFVTSIALGALVFLMTAYAVKAKWNTAVRRLNESIICVFPLLALLFVPIALGLDDLYLWANPPAELPLHEQHALEHRRAYLNETFFIVRGFAYFALWSGCAWFLNRCSLLRDEPRSQGQNGPRSVRVSVAHARERSFSSALLPAVALALTFASFDWLMSLQPFWTSSIFGVYFFAGGFVAAFGLLSILAYVSERRGAAASIRPPHFHALGRLMFAFTVFWAYCAFFQALLVSLPNRPEEVVFYRERLTGGWDSIAWALVVTRFVVPFFLLLPRSMKFDGRAMAGLGAWILFGHYIDMFWLVAPIQHGAAPRVNVWYLCALAAVVAPSVAFAARWMHGKAVVPVGDPALVDSIAYRSPI